jgi:uncharacterized C2H2 Zn-finger protein
MINCPGCGKEFTISIGYKNHLRQTHDPRCAAIYRQSIQYSDNSDSDSEESDLEVDLDVDIAPFSPDSDDDIDFSNYMALDEGDDGGKGFDGGEDVLDNFDGEYRSEDESSDDDFVEEGWEAPPDAELLQMDVDEEQGDMELPLPREVRFAAEELLRRKPFVESFPSDIVGTPVPNKRSAHWQERYKDNIPQSHGEWAPFSSRMDWEVARWAKLRGPGSTAFSELLAIEGVCMIIF